jgi:hypothetical protein
MSDRKYRHRGYQDSEREEDRKARRPPAQGPGGQPRIEGGPRGRGVGLPQSVVFKCALCGTPVKALTEIEPDSECSKCGKPLHSCTNCTFFDTGARFECRRPIQARIESKAKANECPEFQPKTVRDLKSAPAASQGSPQRPDDARSAFEALFKK